jgi:hypothetical protein
LFKERQSELTATIQIPAHDPEISHGRRENLKIETGLSPGPHNSDIPATAYLDGETKIFLDCGRITPAAKKSKNKFLII